jgi:perosamine synthetase
MDKAPAFKVPYAGQGSILGQEELDAVARVMKQKSLAFGPNREIFEAEFARYVGVKYAYTMSNCTTALFLIGDLLGLGPGDEVITTPQTYFATVRGLQARKVDLKFADIDPNSLNIDPATIEAKITPRTKAIYLVHMGGLMADMDPIMEIARRHNLYVVEDCAHTPGAEYKGRKAGSIGDIGCFSFHSLKNMSTLGEGGMITLNRDDWAAKIRPMSWIGALYQQQPREERFGPYTKSTFEYYDHSNGSFSHDAIGPVEVGNNYRLSESACAIGSVQLRKLDALNARRRSIAHRLNEGLAKIDGIRVQQVADEFKHIYHLYVFFYQPVHENSNLEKDELIRILMQECGIEVIQRFFPIHLLADIRCQGHGFGECPVAEKVWFEQHVNLPVYPTLTDEQVDYMIEKVGQAVKRVRQSFSL